MSEVQVHLYNNYAAHDIDQMNAAHTLNCALGSTGASQRPHELQTRQI